MEDYLSGGWFTGGRNDDSVFFIDWSLSCTSNNCLLCYLVAHSWSLSDCSAPVFCCIHASILSDSCLSCVPIRIFAYYS